MAHSEQQHSAGGLASVTTVLFGIFLLTIFAAQPAQAQTFQVLHTFTGGSDGGVPGGNLVMDRAGNLYGATGFDGVNQSGVFKLAKRGSAWILTPLYIFSLSSSFDTTALVLGPDGSLYGTNSIGGGGGPCGGGLGCGTLFKLTPPATTCKGFDCPWTLTILYRFTGHADGGNPASLIFDQAGNLYGTAFVGGNLSLCQSSGCGVVFKFTPSHDGWTETVLYSFNGQPNDGSGPGGQLLFDSAGNLYGTTDYAGTDDVGTAFELSPSQSGWTETILHNFISGSGGYYPKAGFISDTAGKLYSTAELGGSSNWGTVFSLAPSNGGWVEATLHSFDGEYGDGFPFSSLSMDAAGNLVGASSGTFGENHGHGNVFKLTRSNGWTYNSLYSFTGGSDGAFPLGTVIMDAGGNLYGTATGGGVMNNQCDGGCGTVWEITP